MGDANAQMQQIVASLLLISSIVLHPSASAQKWNLQAEQADFQQQRNAAVSACMATRAGRMADYSRLRSAHDYRGASNALFPCQNLLDDDELKRLVSEADALAEKHQPRERKTTAATQKRGVVLGMSTAEVRKTSWGAPDKINSTIRASGTSEQWVYGGGNYLYFENGVLTSVQTSR